MIRYYFLFHVRWGHEFRKASESNLNFFLKMRRVCKFVEKLMKNYKVFSFFQKKTWIKLRIYTYKYYLRD
jgi:hypothetical protein